MIKFKDFESVFQVLFKANLFSRTFQDSLVYLSTFQARANPGLAYIANNMNPDQTAPLSSLIRIHIVCFQENI